MALTINTRKSEFTFYDYRTFFINTPLLGSCYARAEREREGIYWLDFWCGNDTRTAYNLSIGKWCLTHDLPRWLVPQRYALKDKRIAEYRANREEQLLNDLAD